MSKGKKIALWTVSILLGVMYLFGGLMKLIKGDEVKPMFVHYGYAAWFATFIGTCESLGGIGLLIPRLAGLAAAGLSIIMVGAFFTHELHHEYGHGLIPLVLCVLLIWIARTRMSETRA
jgi:uncharacterized membrane protein YphA (DoxX/SURF4 family)